MSGFDNPNLSNTPGKLGVSTPGTYTHVIGGKIGTTVLTSNQSMDIWGNIYVAPTGPWEIQNVAAETVGANLGTISNNYTASASNLTAFASLDCTGYYAGIISGSGTMTIKGGPENIGGVSYPGGGTIVYTANNVYSGATTIQTGARLQLGVDTSGVNGKMVNSQAVLQSGAVLDIYKSSAVWPGTTGVLASFNNQGGTINYNIAPGTDLLLNSANGNSTNNGTINVVTGNLAVTNNITNYGDINLASGTRLRYLSGVISAAVSNTGNIISNGAVVESAYSGSGTQYGFQTSFQNLIVNGVTSLGYTRGFPAYIPAYFNLYFTWWGGLEVNNTLNIYGAHTDTILYSDFRVGDASYDSRFTGSGTINLWQGCITFGTAGGAQAARVTYNGTLNVQNGATLGLRNFQNAFGNDALHKATVYVKSGGKVLVYSSNDAYSIGSLQGDAGGLVTIGSVGMNLINQSPTPVKAVIAGSLPLVVYSPGTFNTEAVNTLTGVTSVGGTNAPGGGIGGGYATTGKVAGLTMSGAFARLVVNPITTSSASKLTCTALTAASGFKVDITGPLDAGTYTILAKTSGSTSVPTINTNLSGRTASFAWSGNNLQMSLS